MNKPRIKIAFFLPNLEGGGGERSVLNLLKGLNKENHKISIVLEEKRGDFLKDVPKEVSIIDLSTLRLPGIFFKFIRYFQKEKPDIFISTFPRFNLIILLAKFFSRRKVKFIITERTTVSGLYITARKVSHRLIAYFLLPYLIRLIYPKADAIIGISRGVAEDLYKIIRSSQKIRVIYNPIAVEQIYTLAEEPLEHPWFSSRKIPVILAVGRLAKCKDYPNLLMAFNKILQKQPIRLVILGKGSEKSKLERLADKLGLSENIAFLGFQENPYKYMKKASVFVLSSIQEGFGNVIVEAMTCGTPVVSTDCRSGPNEIIENGKNGILVSVSNPKALAEAVLNLLKNPLLRKKLSEEGKKRAQDFSVEKITKEYEKFFQELI